MILCPLCQTIPASDDVDGPMDIFFCRCNRLRFMDDSEPRLQVWEFSRSPKFGGYPTMLVRHSGTLRVIRDIRGPEEVVAQDRAAEVVEANILSARASEVLES